MLKKLKNKISLIELVSYIVCGLMIIWGLVYMILGLLAAYLPVADKYNGFKIADNTIRHLFGLGYFGWGLILAGSFAVVMAAILIFKAKGADKEYEKSQRRAARLSRNTKSEAQVVDAEVK